MSADEVAKNTGKVKYVFIFGNTVCNDYAVIDGKIVIDTPLDVQCELDGNTMTVKKNNLI